MAIQNRRGPYNEFDTSKLLPGEWAVVTTGDQNSTNGTAVYMCFKAGEVKRMATYEDMVDYLSEAAGEVVEQAVGEAVEEATAAAAAANSAASSAEAAAASANEAYTNYEQNNAATATKLKTARTIAGIAFDGTEDVHHLGTCKTPKATAAKTVEINGFVLKEGANVVVKFQYGIAAGSATLNVSGSGAKGIRYKGATLKKDIKNYSLIQFEYDGTNWQIVGDLVEEERIDSVLFEGELENGSQSISAGILNYEMIELICETTAGGATPSPFSVKFSVREMYEKDFAISHVNETGYLCSAKLRYSGSGGSLSVSENKAVDLSSGTTLPVSSGIRIYKIIGYKA